MSSKLIDSSVIYRTITQSIQSSSFYKAYRDLSKAACQIASGSYLVSFLRSYKIEDHLTESCDFMFLFRGSGVAGAIKKLIDKMSSVDKKAKTEKIERNGSRKLDIAYEDIFVSIAIFQVLYIALFFVVRWNPSGSEKSSFIAGISWISILFVFLLTVVVSLQLRSLEIADSKAEFGSFRSVILVALRKTRLLISIFMFSIKYQMKKIVFGNGEEVEGGYKKDV